MTTSSGGGAGNWPRAGQVICSACSAHNPAGSRFCERCGSRLPQRPGETVNFQRPAPAEAPVPAVPADESAAAARSDATVTFERLPQETTEPAAPADENTPAAEGATVLAPGERVVFRADLPETVQPETAPLDRAAATVSFALPPVEDAPPPSLRDAPTVSFDLPHFAAAGEQAASAPERGRQSAGGTGSEHLAPAAQPAGEAPQRAAPPASNQHAMPTAPLPPVTRPPSQPTYTPTGTAQYPVQRADPPPASTGAPPAAQSVYQAPPGVYAGGQQYAGQPQPGGGQQYAGAPTYPVPAASTPYSPPLTGPAPGAPAAGQGYSPAPATGGGNRTLWVVLGIIGVLMVCLLGACMLMVLIAYGNSARASGVATSVATIVATPRR